MLRGGGATCLASSSSSKASRRAALQLQCSQQHAQPQRPAQQAEQATSSSSSSSSGSSSSRRHILGAALGAGLMLLAGPQQQASASTGTLADLVEPFRVFDTNGNGAIDVDELRAMFEQVNGVKVPRDTMRRSVMPTLDFNDDGVVQTDELLRAMSLDLPLDERALAVLDPNGDGMVSLPELRAALGDLGGPAGDAVIRVSFQNADRNADGRLGANELPRALDWVATGILGDIYDLGL